MLSDYTAPKYQLKSFNCPHCNAFAEQYWHTLKGVDSIGYNVNVDFQASCCHYCKKFIIWRYDEMIYPTSNIVQLPDPDMPENIQKDYLEARDIVSKSPRSACMLLRLCIEKICDDKNANGGNLNDKIGDLVSKGLDDRIREKLDAIRVIGGQAVHPLKINLDDDVDLARILFNIVNYIIQKLYTDKKEFEKIDKLIPKPKKDAIKKRDADKS